MSATVQIGDVKATVDQEVWSCSDPVILNYLTLMNSLAALPSHTPNPDHSLAELAAKTFGGRVLDYDKITSDPNVIY